MDKFTPFEISKRNPCINYQKKKILPEESLEAFKKTRFLVESPEIVSEVIFNEYLKNTRENQILEFQKESF